MRTTIELSNEQRAALYSMAAGRGMRGYSLLIQEALEKYLNLPSRPALGDLRARESKKAKALMDFLEDGFTTGRPDGSVRHDDYIYRGL